jgi:hypothetical protein
MLLLCFTNLRHYLSVKETLVRKILERKKGKMPSTCCERTKYPKRAKIPERANKTGKIPKKVRDMRGARNANGKVYQLRCQATFCQICGTTNAVKSEM